MADMCKPMDIFGALPLELSQDISQYLEVYQIFQARRVSRRWNTVLSSSYTVESAVLRPWYTEEQPTLCLPESLSEREVIAAKAEHVDACRNGKPFDVRVSVFEDLGSHLSVGVISYAKGILAWVTADEKSVRLRCLASGKSEILASPDGDLIEYLRLDGCNLVAITSSNTCYLWRLVDGVKVESLASKCFGFDDIVIDDWIIDVVVSDFRLAVIYEDRTDKLRVMTMNIQTRITHGFELNLKPPSMAYSDDFKAINAPDGKSMIFFERVLGRESYVHFARIAPDGTVQSEGQIMHPSIENCRRYKRDVGPAPQFDGCVTVWTYWGPLSEVPDTWRLVRICYVQDHLEVKEQTISCTGGTPPALSTDFFLWKDVFYLGNHLDEQGRVEVVDLSESTCKATEMRLLGNPEDLCVSPPQNLESPFLLLGDECFLIGVLEDYCIVWCFDRYLAQSMPKA